MKLDTILVSARWLGAGGDRVDTGTGYRTGRACSHIACAVIRSTITDPAGDVGYPTGARDVDFWSSAARAGIKAGDVIREINREPIRSPADFQTIARTLRPGAQVLMRVQRGDVVL